MKSKPIRAPAEFVAWVDTLSSEFSKQTGLPRNNTATMRRLGTKLKDKIIVNGLDFDWAIWRKKRK